MSTNWTLLAGSANNRNASNRVVLMVMKSERHRTMVHHADTAGVRKNGKGAPKGAPYH